MIKNKNNKSHLIFYHNTEPNNPDKLASSVQNELRYFESFLLKATKSMDVSRYELTWEKDEDLTYMLYPYQILEVKKPKNRIILQIKDAFSERKAIMRENGEQIHYETYEITKEGVVLILKNSEKLVTGEKMWYGREKVDWKFLSSGFSEKVDSIKDEAGGKYNIFKKEEVADSYILHLNQKNRVPMKVTIFINDVKVEYSKKDITTLKGTELHDNNGRLDFSIINEKDIPFRIHTGRKIRDELRDSTGRFYYYSLEEKKKENGVWIVLKEHEEDQVSAEDDQRTKIDIFFELISSSSDFEIWESPDVKHNDNKHRIRIGKIIREENRLLLEREPKTAKIYPPRNTYQLDMQKNAIQTLMFRPAPEHRNLLRLFEPYDKTQWDEPSANHTEWKLKWEFLTDMEREGTDEQREFVLKALNTPDFAILEGPPGSGKTTAISEIIYQLLNQRKRVLLSASTHVAVDNVIEKLEEKYRNSGGAKENGIVPLRIGREESVSEDVIQYQIENRKEVMKKRIENEKWFRDSSPENQKYYLEEMVINSSNLICGTTIGILQFPHFKKAKKEELYIIPEFDYLIIDEASKTTFQEFLVPAIYAKKWIVIGDVRQLSPYTDTLHVRVNLDGVLGDKAKERAQVVFLKLLFDREDAKVDNKWIPPPKFIFVDRLETVKEMFKTLPAKIQKNVERNQGKRRKNLGDYNYAFVTKQHLDMETENVECLDENMLQNKRATLFDKDIIFVEEEVYKMKWGSFPQTHILIRPNTSGQDIHEYRHLDWHLTRGRGEYAYKLPGGKSIENPWDIIDEIMNALRKDWAGELAWRMKRVHELSMAQSDETQGKSKEYYLASMRALMPPDNKESKNAWRQIKKIGQIYLTSVLSSIQEGVAPYWKEENKSVMSHGFIGWVKKPRYTKLSYQHRMHPAISSIPRDIFYRGEALNDNRFVKNEGRVWNYNRYDERVVWIDVKGSRVDQNTNKNESQEVLSELENFVKWVNKQKEKKNVIILSFYEQQRKHIRDILRKKYPKNNRKETRFDIDGVDVRNYTVDKVQGREGDLVLLSMVQNKRVGFMDSPNRLNVALTRAKYQLVIIGDKKYFSTQKNSKELAEIAQRIKSFHRMKI